MKKKSFLIVLSVLLTCSLAFCVIPKNIGKRSQLVSDFKNPPESTKPGIYWYWMNEHVSKEGITKDLEAMKRVGIGEAFIGNIYEGGVPGDVKTMSEEWVECMRHAIREGSRIGVRISIFNGPGWSQSGGPWVKEEEAMRYLNYCDTVIDGGASMEVTLPKFNKFFQQVAVLALPVDHKILKPTAIQIKPVCKEKEKLFDGSKMNTVVFNNTDRGEIEIEISADNHFPCRSLSIYPTGMGFDTECELFIWKDGKYISAAKEFFDRSNTSLQLGPTPNGKLVMSFPAVESSSFKIKLSNLPKNFELSEIELTDEVLVNKVTEKSLYKLPNTSNPAWDAYHWNSQKTDSDITFLTSNQIVDLTQDCKNGSLNWSSKPGQWRIMCFGMTPTYTTNVPAAPLAKGLEIDKLSKKASYKHFNSFVGKVISGLNKNEKKSLHRLIIDSYEVGPQNWSDDYRDKFMAKVGYDPIPYLPVLAGTVIGSVDMSDRFLWDMRRVVADLIAEEYIGGLREIANKSGMNLWLENYGHWGFPSEFLYYGSKADEIGGEFWAGSGPTAECKLASSTCNMYDKNEVFAESYTAGGNYFRWHPAALKQKGDWSYTEGVNSVIMHVYIHQPYEDRVPGVNAWFGIEYNRHNTWFENSKGWIDYQRRCCYLLRQGLPVRDVCIFLGEDTPQMNYWVDSALSPGYSFDIINSDALINRLSVKDGKVVLPNGISYAAMILPPLKEIRPEVMLAIHKLVEQGAVVIANSYPDKSPSLKDYVEVDRIVKREVAQLFPEYGKTQKRVGKGAVYMKDVNQVLKEIGHVKDVAGLDGCHVKWTHRKCDAGDLYFLSNQGNTAFEGKVSFKVKDMLPEFWNAVDGSTCDVKPSNYEHKEEYTIVEVLLNPGESTFVIFSRASGDKKDTETNVAGKEKEVQINSPWNIRFNNQKLNQDFAITSNALFDWKDAEDQRVKYFSGTAFYSTTFDWNNNLNGNVYIHFDNIQVIAKIKLNGKEVGYLWTQPYELDVTEYLTKGQNKLELEVSNLWVNQLVKQYALPVGQRDIWTLIDAARSDQDLEPSGIIGNCYLFTK